LDSNLWITELRCASFRALFSELRFLRQFIAADQGTMAGRLANTIVHHQQAVVDPAKCIFKLTQDGREVQGEVDEEKASSRPLQLLVSGQPIQVSRSYFLTYS
jgi:hypothetical protein